MLRAARRSIPVLLLLAGLCVSAASAADPSALSGGWRINPAQSTPKPGSEAEFMKDREDFAGFIEVIDIPRRTWALFLAEDGFLITDSRITKIDALEGDRFVLHFFNIEKAMIYGVIDKNTLAVEMHSGTFIYKRLPPDKIPKRPKPGEL